MHRRAVAFGWGLFGQCAYRWAQGNLCLQRVPQPFITAGGESAVVFRGPYGVRLEGIVGNVLGVLLSRLSMVAWYFYYWGLFSWGVFLLESGY